MNMNTNTNMIINNTQIVKRPKKSTEFLPDETTLTLKDFSRTKYNLTQLKIIAKRYKLKVTGNKPELQERIYNHLYSSHYAMKIQKVFRGHFVRRYVSMHGPALLDRSLCTNVNDFVTMEPLEEIGFHQFISYKDTDEFIYGFDMNSLHNLYLKSQGEMKNPYNRNLIPPSIIKDIRTIVRMSRILNIDINLSVEDVFKHVSNEKAIELRAVTLFQNIDALGNYSNARWFLSLNRVQIQRFVREIIDIWNYRAQLTIEMKRNICPPYGNPFIHLNLEYLVTEPNLWNVKNMILACLERFVNNGVDHDSKTLGAYYVLGALTIVNNDAATSMPWLFQSFI